MSRECVLGVHIGPLNPPKRGLKTVENRASRAQPPGLSVWRVEFKSPLAHSNNRRSEAYGRHPGTLGVRWGYRVQRSAKSREHPETHMKRPRIAPTTGAWPTGLEST